MACESGKYATGMGNDEEGDCEICVAGKYGASIGLSRCTDCERGKFSQTQGATGCSECPSFSTSPKGSDNQTNCKCKEGYFGPDSEHCGACPTGLVSGVGANECSIPEKELDDDSVEKIFLAFGVLPIVLIITVGVVLCFRSELGLGHDRCQSVFKIACGMLDFTSDLIFVSLLDPREPIRFGIAVAACVLSTFSSLLIAVSYGENFFLLLTTSLDTKEDHNIEAARINRWIVLFVEDVTFFGLEISLLSLGKKLNGLDWVIWSQALGFTLINVIRNVWSTCKGTSKISPSEAATDGVAVVQSFSQAVVSQCSIM